MTRIITTETICAEPFELFDKIEVSFVEELDIFMRRPYQVLKISNNKGHLICVHNSDLLHLVSLLKDISTYAAFIEKGDKSYYMQDKGTGIEALCYYNDGEEGQIRITLSHCNEHDENIKNLLTLSPVMLAQLIDSVETVLMGIVLADMMAA